VLEIIKDFEAIDASAFWHDIKFSLRHLKDFSFTLRQIKLRPLPQSRRADQWHRPLSKPLRVFAANYSLMDLSIWVFADPITIEQAACLWVGVDPAKNPFSRPQDEASKVAAMVQTLSGGVAVGLLEVDSSKNPLSNIGNYSASLVSREALRAFAERKGQRPPFLFDVLIGDAFKTKHSESALQARSTSHAQAKGGRPAEYDWDGFITEIIRIADLDSLPEKQSELVSRMLEWCNQNWGKEPAESSVKGRISLIYNKLGRGRKPPAL